LWYSLSLAALDAGKLPLIMDEATRQGSDLIEVAGHAGACLHDMVGLLRGTNLAFLEGFGFLTVEVQKWASLSSFEQHGEGAGESLRAMRRFVRDALLSGGGSPRTGTPTTPSGFSLN
jgi:hypothetical protein